MRQIAVAFISQATGVRAMLTGRCLCGAVTYEIDAEPAMAGHCYCRDCQRATGASHVSAFGVPREALRVQGELKSVTLTSDGGGAVTRYFCPQCGSGIYGANGNSPMVNVSAGTLDDLSAFQPQFSIFVRSRPAWARFDSALMEFDAMPPMPA
jgi:hypothetical protein